MADVDNAAQRAGRIAVVRFEILGRTKRGAIEDSGTDISKASAPFGFVFELLVYVIKRLGLTLFNDGITRAGCGFLHRPHLRAHCSHPTRTLRKSSMIPTMLLSWKTDAHYYHLRSTCNMNIQDRIE